MSHLLDRRRLLAGGASFAALALAGCTSSGSGRRVPDEPRIPADVLAMYAAVPNEPFPIPAARVDRIDPKYWRQVVDDPTGERPGTVVVDTANRFLYLVRGDGTAMRYGVGIGRDGFTWQGRAKVGRKAEWPTWTPTKEMMERQPETREFAGGMPPGLTNPLGARALYIYQDGRDTLYRLHGTMEVWSIGGAVSSGCVRLLFHDVIDLYNRAPVGTPIVVNA